MRGKRLSLKSSGLPRFVVPENGVQDCEQLSSNCDEGDDLWLSVCDQAITEGFEDRIVAACDHCGDEEGGADVFSAAADHAFALPTSGLPRVRRQAGQAGDGLAVERAKLWQLGDEGAGGLGTHPGYR